MRIKYEKGKAKIMGRKMIKRLIAGMLTATVAIPTNFMPVQAGNKPQRTM